MDESTFDDMIEQCTEGYSDVYIGNASLRDASFFYFQRKIEYAEIKAQSSYAIKQIYLKLQDAIKDFYAAHDVDFDEILASDRLRTQGLDSCVGTLQLTPEDRLIIASIETPFRFTANCLSLNEARYYLSTVYGLPLVGWMNIDESKFIDHEELTNAVVYKDYPVQYVNAIDVLETCQPIHCSDPPPLIMAAYDIETYTNEIGVVPHYSKQGDEIIAIGVGMFNVHNNTPFEKVCFISHDMQPPLKHETLSAEEIKDKFNIVGVTVYAVHEYETVYYYICCNNEKHLLMRYIKYMLTRKPDIIATFNGYGYDDRYVYNRCLMHGLVTNFMQIYTVYTYDRLHVISKGIGCNMYIYPKYMRVRIKIDNQRDGEDYTIKGSNVVSIDAYKINLKANPKKFSREGRGNLNTMLEVYKIPDPFTGIVAQKTGLSIPDMMKYWREGTHTYEIAKYCLQDSYITGCLIVDRGTIYDCIEQANSSCTSLENSFFRADAFRVNKVLTRYAQRFGFAFMDLPPTTRSEHKEEDGDGERRKAYRRDYTLGLKTNIHDTILGGAVKNISPGRNRCVIALDFSSMYPSQKEGSNIDSSTAVSTIILGNPSAYELEVERSYQEFDNYSTYDSQWRDGAQKVSTLMEKYYHDGKPHPSDLWQAKRDKYIIRDKTTNVRYRVEKYYGEYKDADDHVYSKECWYVQNHVDDTSQDTFQLVFPDGVTPENNYRLSLKGIMLYDMRQLRNKAKADLKKAGKRLETATTQAERTAAELDKIRFNAKQLAYKILCNSEYGASDNKCFAHYDSLVAASVTCCSRRTIAFLKYILEFGEYYVTEQDIKNVAGHLKLLGDLVVMRESDCPPETDMYLPKTWNRKEIKYQLILPPSKVIYQDTDSNYYINETIRSAFQDETTIMDRMNAYNEIVSYLCRSIINRNPLSTGFEGAFIVARYFNVKKKYYGYVWSSGMKLNIKKDVYYFWLDTKKIHDADNSIDYVDFIKKEGVKVTGIDLARRDQYKFINLCHIELLQNDLSKIPNDQLNMLQIVKKLLMSFRAELAKGDEGMYTLKDFVKTQKYKVGLKTKNAPTCIKERVQGTPLDFNPGDYVSYVIVKGAGCVNERAKLVAEVHDLTELDFEYYVRCLANALAQYVVDDLYALHKIDEKLYKIAVKVSDDDVEDKETKEAADKCKEQASKYLFQMFYSKKSSFGDIHPPITNNKITLPITVAGIGQINQTNLQQKMNTIGIKYAKMSCKLEISKDIYIKLAKDRLQFIDPQKYVEYFSSKQEAKVFVEQMYSIITEDYDTAPQFVSHSYVRWYNEQANIIGILGSIINQYST